MRWLVLRMGLVAVDREVSLTAIVPLFWAAGFFDASARVPGVVHRLARRDIDIPWELIGRLGL